jgi:hypothetical protein
MRRFTMEFSVESPSFGTIRGDLPSNGAAAEVLYTYSEGDNGVTNQRFFLETNCLGPSEFLMTDKLIKPWLVIDFVPSIVSVEEFCSICKSHKRQLLSNQPNLLITQELDLYYTDYYRLVQALRAIPVSEYTFYAKRTQGRLIVYPEVGFEAQVQPEGVVSLDQMVSQPLCGTAIFRLIIEDFFAAEFPGIMERILFEDIPILLHENPARRIIIDHHWMPLLQNAEYIPTLLENIGKMGLEHLQEANITFKFVEELHTADANEAVEASRRLRRERHVAFAMGGHPRLGVQSPINILGGLVAEFVRCFTDNAGKVV